MLKKLEKSLPAGIQRDTVLDALRLIAILLMIASHTSRLIVPDERREWSRFSLLIEPLTASLFLALVGASLALSWQFARDRGRYPWYRKQALRAVALWVVSCIFYTLEDGFHFPDAVTMSGILATIAYTILLCMVLVSSPKPIILLVTVTAALMGWHSWLDASGDKLFVINSGNSPLLPLLTMACLGALGVIALEKGGQKVRLAIVAGALLTMAVILFYHDFAEVFSKPLGRYESSRTLVSHDGELSVEKVIPYYNLRPILVPVITAIIILLYAGLALVRPILNKTARFLLPMGRNSLDIYIFHLFLLAILVLSGGNRPLDTAWQGDLAILTVIALAYGWVLLRERFPLRKRKSKQTAA